MSTQDSSIAARGRRSFLCLLGVFACFAACGGSEEGLAPSAGASLRAGSLDYRPSIVLITVDTLRRDHMGCYGYFRDTTPNLDAFAGQSLVFERALAPMATTYPSHLSMLTGVYPHQHGRTSNQDGVRNPFLSTEGCASIAEALSGAGYATSAVVSSRVLDGKTGIDDGFESYRSPSPAPTPLLAAETTDLALAWLAGRDASRPFFLWVHYWDTHEPNQPREPYASAFQSDAELAAWIEARGIDVPGVVEKFGDDGQTVERFLTPSRRNRPGRRGKKASTVGPDRVDDLFNRYDGDLLYVDTEIGRLFDALRAAGVWDRSVIAFTADHGQALGENLQLGHGKITNVNTFVPLILRFPEGVVPEPGRVPGIVSLVDLVPTLLGRMEPGFLAGFRTQLVGSDLLSGGFDRPFALTEESTRFRGSEEHTLKVALVTDRWKYVYSAEVEELYALGGSNEAMEGPDVLGDHGALAAELRSITLELLEKDRSTAAGGALSEEDTEELLQNLRDLGYAGDD